MQLPKQAAVANRLHMQVCLQAVAWTSAIPVLTACDCCAGVQVGSTILAQAAGVPTLAWSGSGVAISYADCNGDIPQDIYDKVSSLHKPTAAALQHPVHVRDMQPVLQERGEAAHQRLCCHAYMLCWK